MKKEKQKNKPLKSNVSIAGPLPTEVPSNTRFSSLLGVAIIILLGIIIYSNSFNCSFHFDDYANFVDVKFPHLTDFTAWWNYSQTRLIGFYSFALNRHFNDVDVWGFHLVNLIIHLINSCLIWWLSHLILSSPALKDNPIVKYKNELAFFTALLFVSHPLATQSVTYVVQRLTSLVALFYLLSIALYMKGRLSDAKNNLKILLFVGAFISTVFAMLTKENAFTLPFAIVLVEFCFINTKRIDINFKDYRFVLLMSGLIGFILMIVLKFSFSVFKPIPPGQGINYTITSINYLLTQFSVIVKYIQLLFMPINQMLDYDFPISNSLFEIRTIISFSMLLFLIIFAISCFNKYRIISFGIFWFLLTLSIESSFIPIRDLIFEHRTYLPSLGIFLIISSGLYGLLYEKFKFIFFTILLIIIGSNSYLTYQRNKVWKNDLSLWSDNVAKAPNSARANCNRANAYARIGQHNKAIADLTKAIGLSPNYAKAYFNRGFNFWKLGNMEKALHDYSQAVQINPLYSEAYLNRGIAYGNLKEWEQAIADYGMAIEVNPNFKDAYLNRGIALGQLEKWNLAIIDHSKAIGFDSNYKEAFLNRGIALGNINEWDEAIVDYTSAIKINPNYREAYVNRGNVYRSFELWEKAITDYNFAIKIDPNFAKAYSNLGNVYEKIKQWDKAIANYTLAIKINPNYKEAYLNRGVAFYNNGQFEKAIEDYNNAIRIDPSYSLAFKNLEAARNQLKK